MAKRTAASTAASRPKKHQKRQAVTQTRDATTKALIERNKKNSPLLNLPVEVRDRILLNVVGNEIITIQRSTTTPRLDLGILGVSRQCYEESYIHLWGSNTFSFQDAKSLNRFLSSLNAGQKRKLQKVKITTAIGNIRLTDHASYTNDEWKNALTTTKLKTLYNLQHLHLSFEVRDNSSFHGFPNVNIVDTIKQCWNRDVEPFLRFRIIALKNVTIDIDNTIPPNLHPGLIVFRLTAAEKGEFIEGLHSTLTDPQAVELAKTTAVAEKLAALETSRDKAKAKKENAQRRITQSQSSADYLRQRARDSAACEKSSQAMAEAGFAFDDAYYAREASRADEAVEEARKKAALNAAKYERVVAHLKKFRKEIGAEESEVDGEDEASEGPEDVLTEEEPVDE